MGQIAITSCTVDEFAQARNLDVLFAAYQRESSIPGLGPCNVQLDKYRQLEAAGALHTFVAYRGPDLVGFLSMIVTVLPHYGALVATTESFFVAEDARAGGTGMKLLRRAEDHARGLGAVGLLVSAPHGGRLAKIMPRAGYQETNRVFFRGLQ